MIPAPRPPAFYRGNAIGAAKSLSVNGEPYTYFADLHEWWRDDVVRAAANAEHETKCEPAKQAATPCELGPTPSVAGVEYPAYVCLLCGDQYGAFRASQRAEWHQGTCGLCNQARSVTKTASFGHLRTLPAKP